MRPPEGTGAVQLTTIEVWVTVPNDGAAGGWPGKVSLLEGVESEP